MAKQVKVLKTIINTQFLPFQISYDELIKSEFADTKISYEEKKLAIDSCIENFIKNEYIKCNLEDLISRENEKSNYSLICIRDYKYLKRENEKKKQGKDVLIYEFVHKFVPDKSENNKIVSHYAISTGIYCGILTFPNGKKLLIDCGYSNTLFKRMLDFCCGIYVNSEKAPSELESNSLYSLLPQYLFLTSLRKVIVNGFPKKYIKKYDRGYSINGTFDVNSYINHDIVAFDQKLTYFNNNQLEVQNIIDCLYTAVCMCKLDRTNDILPNLTKYKNYLHGLYSGRRPNKNIIRKALSDSTLSSSLYSDYKVPLKYAKVLIDRSSVSDNTNGTSDGVSGILVDASFLWEMYLYNLMRLNLDDKWDISAQSEINFYNDTFYDKTNYPDFVLTNRENGNIYILDAKFKKMEYRTCDVDNDDLQQLHSYSYYYHLKCGERFRGTGLIYPSKEFRKNDTKKNVDKMFGIETSTEKFGVFSIKDPGENETMSGNELKFIEELKNFLND